MYIKRRTRTGAQTRTHKHTHTRARALTRAHTHTGKKLGSSLSFSSDPLVRTHHSEYMFPLTLSARKKKQTWRPKTNRREFMRAPGHGCEDRTTVTNTTDTLSHRPEPGRATLGRRQEKKKTEPIPPGCSTQGKTAIERERERERERETERDRWIKIGTNMLR